MQFAQRLLRQLPPGVVAQRPNGRSRRHLCVHVLVDPDVSLAAETHGLLVWLPLMQLQLQRPPVNCPKFPTVLSRASALLDGQLDLRQLAALSLVGGVPTHYLCCDSGDPASRAAARFDPCGRADFDAFELPPD